MEQLKALGRGFLSWVAAKSAVLAILAIGAVGFYVEHSALKDTPAGQTALYVVKGLISIVGLS